LDEHSNSTSHVQFGLLSQAWRWSKYVSYLMMMFNVSIECCACLLNVLLFYMNHTYWRFYFYHAVLNTVHLWVYTSRMRINYAF
jgi:hypothetical protein